MEKQWLIRLNSEKILGPWPRQKVIDYIAQKPLSDQDELCSGNGYWFFFKEKPLVERFLYKGEVQDFNPVSEAVFKRQKAALEEQEKTGVFRLEEIQRAKNTSNNKPQVSQKPQANQKKVIYKMLIAPSLQLLKMMGYVLLLFVLLAIYYRKRILKKILNPSQVSYSQDSVKSNTFYNYSQKKKYFLI